MRSERWRTVWSTRGTLDPAADARPITSLPAASNVFGISRVEMIHRSINPPPPISVPDYLYADPWSNPCAVPNSEPVAKQSETECSPPLIEPPERDLGAEVAKLLKPATEYLDGFLIAEPPDDFERGYRDPLSTSKPAIAGQSPEVAGFESQKAALLADLRAWSESLAEFLADHREWRTAELQKRHATAWREARDQQRIVDGIAAEHGQHVAEMRRLQSELSNVRALRQAHEAARPDLDTLPSQTDIDSWASEDERLQSAYTAADTAVEGERERQRALWLRHQRETVKLAALRATERDLRSKLSGEVIPVLGLEERPEL